MSYSFPRDAWTRKDLDVIVSRMRARERSEPILGHAADAIESLRAMFLNIPIDCPECGYYIREDEDLWNT